MYTGTVWGITLLIAGFLATLISFELLLAALAPARHAAATRTLREHALGSAFLGVGIVLVVVLLVAVLSALGGPGKFLAALLIAFVMFPVGIGLAAVSRFVGERMPSPKDAGRPWRATLRGGATCGLAFALPLVGWFLLFPAAILTGLGAVALSAFSRSPAPAAAPTTEAGAAA